MGYLRKKFDLVGFDLIEYKRYFRQHQLEYIRKKLRCVQLYSSGKSFSEVAQHFGIHEYSVRTYINTYLKSGFSGLCERDKCPKKTKLSKEQEAEFKSVLLEKKPIDVGLDANIWTGPLMCTYLEKTYDVSYGSGIYKLLNRLNLSHQKAHADYGNAKKEDQIAFFDKFVDTFLAADKDTAIVKFDEFSVSNRPSSYYGWAEKNTRPKFVTDEKKETDSTDF